MVYYLSLNYDVSSDLKAQVGLDYRTARIYHVKTIRDLLGGDYYMTSDSEFDSDNGQGGLGDPIDYNFTNYVNWLGLFGQVEYSMNALKTYAMAGMTTVKLLIGITLKMLAIMIIVMYRQKMLVILDFVEGLGRCYRRSC